MNTLKKITVICAIIFGSLLSAQSNMFLKRDFWGSKPSVEDIKTQIKAGNNPSEANSNNFDGVVYAILQDAPTESIVYLMSQKGNDVNKLTHDGRTYIFWAAYKGNTDIVEYLLKNGAKTDLTDDKGNTIITFAAAAGQQNTEVYDLLIEADKTLVSKTNPDGANALLLAAPRDEDFKLINYFKSKGLSLKSTDSNGNGIFNYVARTGNFKLLKELEGMGLNGNDKAFIFTAYGARGHVNNVEAYKFLKEVGLNPNVADKDGITPLHIVASRSDDKEIFNFLLENGLDVNTEDAEGNTAFINAASRNNLEVVKLFASEVKDINKSNKKGETALALAVKNNTKDVVSFLIEKGADLKFKDQKGNNIVYYLVEGYSTRNETKFIEKLNLLNENDVDFSTPQKNGNTLYHLAAEKQSLKLLELAASYKLDVNAKNEEGNTALHIAAMKAKDADILKFLIEQGADVKATTDFDESVYDLASENELLKKNNIDINFLN